MRVSIHMGGLFLLSQARQALLTQQIVVILEFLWIKNLPHLVASGGLGWLWLGIFPAILLARAAIFED